MELKAAHHTRKSVHRAVHLRVTSPQEVSSRRITRCLFAPARVFDRDDLVQQSQRSVHFFPVHTADSSPPTVGLTLLEKKASSAGPSGSSRRTRTRREVRYS